MSQADTKLMKAHGGTVTGDAHQTWDYTLARRMQQIAELGLNLHAENLEPEE